MNTFLASLVFAACVAACMGNSLVGDDQGSYSVASYDHAVARRAAPAGGKDTDKFGFGGMGMMGGGMGGGYEYGMGYGGGMGYGMGMGYPMMGYGGMYPYGFGRR